jgi:hypothetical protein
MFQQLFSNPAHKPYWRVALVVACVGALSFLGFAVVYHREWFSVPFSKYAAFKVAFKSLKWIGAAAIFWFGKKYFSKTEEAVQTENIASND